MIRSFLVIFTACFFTGVVQAQEPLVRERTGSETILFETHYILSEADSHAVVVSYRIRNNFFVFTRSLTSLSEEYHANADAITEILDSTGNSIARKIENITLSAETNVSTELRKQYRQGLMKFQLPAGKYNVLFRIEDKESRRTSPDITRLLIIPSFKNLRHSSLIPVEAEGNGSHEYKLFNLGGDIVFSKDFGFLFASKKSDIQTIRYSVTRTFGEEYSEHQKVIDTTVQCFSLHSSALDFLYENNAVTASVQQNGDSEIYFFPVRGSQLPQGRYEIVVTFSDTTAKAIFATRWLDMPMTLNDLDIATYPLQYLLTEDDYSALRRGTRETRIQKFEEFWKKKDPTPATAMNEMMAEFYRRVDYTITAFRTLKEPNGSLTDRGRIYILFGKPTSTERSLYPNSTSKEVWKYQNLKKTFVFEDQSKQGNYKLAESK